MEAVSPESLMLHRARRSGLGRLVRSGYIALELKAHCGHLSADRDAAVRPVEGVIRYRAAIAAAANLQFADKAVLHGVEVANTGDHFTEVAFYRANREKKSPSERPLSSLSDMIII